MKTCGMCNAVKLSDPLVTKPLMKRGVTKKMQGKRAQPLLDYHFSPNVAQILQESSPTVYVSNRAGAKINVNLKTY